MGRISNEEIFETIRQSIRFCATCAPAWRMEGFREIAGPPDVPRADGRDSHEDVVDTIGLIGEKCIPPSMRRAVGGGADSAEGNPQYCESLGPGLQLEAMGR